MPKPRVVNQMVVMSGGGLQVIEGDLVVSPRESYRARQTNRYKLDCTGKAVWRYGKWERIGGRHV